MLNYNGIVKLLQMIHHECAHILKFSAALTVGKMDVWIADRYVRPSSSKKLPMLERKKHVPGTAPATLVAPPSAGHERTTVSLIEYNESEFRETRITEIEDVFGCLDNDCVSWINIDGLGDLEVLRKIGTHFGIHPLALEDVLDTNARPKLEEFPEHFFIVHQLATMDDASEIQFEQSCIFLGRNFLITMQDRERDVFEAIRTRLRRGRGFARTRGHDYLAYALIDANVDHFFPLLEQLGERIEDLEDELIAEPTEDLLEKLHDIKRALLQLRRAAWPSREIINGMIRDPSGMVREDTRVFLRDCYDHIVQIIDVVESYRDLSAGMMDLYLSSLSNKTNEVMRVLTVVTTVFIPLTFIAGVYGMNFDSSDSPFNMPELHWYYGYPAALAVMGTIAIVLLFLFKRKHWL